MGGPGRNSDNGVSVTVVRYVHAPVSAVYRAWCEPAILAEWLAPGGDEIASVSVDLREGGKFRIDGAHPEGDAYSISGTYLELSDGERIVLAWRYSGPVSALRTDKSVVAADFIEEEENLTRLAITHTRLDDDQAAEITRVAWKSCLDKLEVSAARVKKRPKKAHEAHPDFFTASQRTIQDQLSTRPIADRLEALLVKERIDAADAAFIAGQNMLFMATVDACGRPNCSYKGGARGFVSVIDEQSLAFPVYDGNGMQLSLGNIADTGQVALLFVDFDRQARLRVSGQACFTEADPLLEIYPDAQLIVRVTVETVFSNCPRYVHKMKLVKESDFTPAKGKEPPVAHWKRLHAVADALPEKDRRHASVGVDFKKALNRDR